jgi:hypothetical protein
MNLSPNFSDTEMAVSGVVPRPYLYNVLQTARLLQWIRNKFGVTVPTSVMRTPEHNASVGGVPDSQHLVAGAADAIVANTGQRTVAAYVMAQVAAGFAPQFSQFIAYANDRHFHIGIPFTDGRANHQLLIKYAPLGKPAHYAQLDATTLLDVPDLPPGFASLSPFSRPVPGT